MIATSIAAYAQNKPKAPAQRAMILEYIRSRALDGATSDEAEVALDLPHQTCSARFKDLKDAGEIQTIGEVRKTRSGCKAMVFIARGGL